MNKLKYCKKIKEINQNYKILNLQLGIKITGININKK